METIIFADLNIKVATAQMKKGEVFTIEETYRSMCEENNVEIVVTSTGHSFTLSSFIKGAKGELASIIEEVRNRVETESDPEDFDTDFPYELWLALYKTQIKCVYASLRQTKKGFLRTRKYDLA